MRSEQQHIDDFIRNKSDEFNPGQHDMQANWQQMQGLLSKAPGKYKVTKVRKLIKYVGGIAVVTIITITLIQLNNKKKPVAQKKVETKANVVAAKPAADIKPASANKTNTIALVNSTNSTKTVPAEKPTASKTVAKKSVKQKLVHAVPIKKVADPQIAVIPEIKKEKKPDPLLILKDFYAQLEKTPQEFLILADRDTVIKAKEGTRLKIPAKTFDKKTGTIKIILTEFYDDEDMITQKLSTTSNGKQLVTGGMLNIRAEVDGQPVQIAPDKSIKIEMPTESYDDKMQLYTGIVTTQTKLSYLHFREQDRTAWVEENNSPEMIDWVPAGQEQSLSQLYAPRIFKVPDIAGEPYKVHYGKDKITAKFLVSKDVKMSNREVKEKLKRYSLYYDEIKVRRLWFGPNFLRFGKEELPVIKGDSIVMKFESALRLKLVSKEDSLRYRQLLYQDSVQRETKRKYLNNYTFEVRGTGWINCDKMYNIPGPRVEFTINLGQGVEAGNFISQLVFTNFRSMVPGYYENNKIRFTNMPLDQPAYFVTVGVVDGKVVSTIKSLNVSRQEVTDITLEETSSEQFRKEVKNIVKSIPR